MGRAMLVVLAAGVLLGVLVGVLLGVLVGELVGVLLGEAVGVLVGVAVGVLVGVLPGTVLPALLAATTVGDGSPLPPEPPPQAAKWMTESSDTSPAALKFFIVKGNNRMLGTHYFYT